MKPVTILVCLLLCSLSLFAQTGKRKTAVRTINPKPGTVTPYKYDSLTLVKKNPGTVQTTNAKSRTTPQRVNNTKLDDLKNPFDTLRSAQPRTVAAPRQTARTKNRPVTANRIDSLKGTKPPAVIQKQN